MFMSVELCLVEYVCTTDKTLLPFPIKTRRVEKRNPVPCIFATLPTAMPTLSSQKYWCKSDVRSTIFTSSLGHGHRLGCVLVVGTFSFWSNFLPAAKRHGFKTGVGEGHLGPVHGKA